MLEEILKAGSVTKEMLPEDFEILTPKEQVKHEPITPTMQSFNLNNVWYNDMLDHKLPLKFEFIRL